jgi:hypothetical protein
MASREGFKPLLRENSAKEISRQENTQHRVAGTFTPTTRYWVFSELKKCLNLDDFT